MADAKNLMGVSVDDIKSIMGVDVGDIKSVMGFDLPSGGQWFGSRHFMAGTSANSWSETERISYKASTSSGDVSDFGDLITGSPLAAGSGCGNGKARGIVGSRYASGSHQDDIDYFATTSTGDASDFGENGEDGDAGMASSNGTLLFFTGCALGSSPYVTDRMEYITVATLGNATDAGNLLDQLSQGMCASGNSRGSVMGGVTRDSDDGYIRYAYQAVDYHEFHTSNNASDFGDLSQQSYLGAGLASETRWVCKNGHRYTSAGGNEHHINMDFFTVDTTGNASDFGDCAGRTQYLGGMADGTRGEWWGGNDASGTQGSAIDSISYITIASASDHTDAGNLHAAGLGNNTFSGAAS